MYIGPQVNCPLFLSDFNETWIVPDRFSRKKIEFHENLYIWSRVVPCGQKDRHDEATCHFSQFCKRAI